MKQNRLETDQPMFLNCCIEIETDLSLLKLLSACQKSKNNLPPLNPKKAWVSCSTIDIDILFYGNEILDTPRLKIRIRG